MKMRIFPKGHSLSARTGGKNWKASPQPRSSLAHELTGVGQGGQLIVVRCLQQACQGLAMMLLSMMVLQLLLLCEMVAQANLEVFSHHGWGTEETRARSSRAVLAP